MSDLYTQLVKDRKIHVRVKRTRQEIEIALRRDHLGEPVVEARRMDGTGDRNQMHMSQEHLKEWLANMEPVRSGSNQHGRGR